MITKDQVIVEVEDVIQDQSLFRRDVAIAGDVPEQFIFDSRYLSAVDGQQFVPAGYFGSGLMIKALV